jgi:hypothetical protein
MAKRQSIKSPLPKTHTRSCSVRPGYHIVPHDTTRSNIHIAFCVLPRINTAEYPAVPCCTASTIDTLQAGHIGLFEFTLALGYTTTGCCREYRHSIKALGTDTVQAQVPSTGERVGSGVLGHTLPAASSTATTSILPLYNEPTTHRATPALHRANQPSSVLGVSPSVHTQDADVAWRRRAVRHMRKGTEMGCSPRTYSTLET